MSCIALLVLQKLERYSVLVKTRTARFALFADSRFMSDILKDRDVLCSFVAFKDMSEKDTGCNPLPSKRAFIEGIMNDDTIDLNGDDKIERFLHAKMSRDRGTKLLVW